MGGVQAGADRRADREGCVRRRPHPGQNLDSILWPHERQSPGERPCDDEALRAAEYRPVQEQDCD
jgi:hypothetical protein